MQDSDLAKVEEITLDGLAYGGEAFGRASDGRMIFVPFALPGERVQVQLVEEHKRWARARLLALLERSTQRVDAHCRHFGECGGCHYQHLAYSDQLIAKESILRAQLERIGGMQAPPVAACIPCPSPLHARNHMQFSLTSEGDLGFSVAGSERVIAIQECYLPLPSLCDLWPRIDVQTLSGLTRVALREGTYGDSMVVFHADTEPGLEIFSELPASIVWLEPDGISILAGDDRLNFHVLGRSFAVSAPSFFQVNTPLLETLVQRVLAALNPRAGQTIWDLYAGVGLFSAFIADVDARVVAVEESPWACLDFEHNLHSFDDVKLYEAPVELALPSLESTPDAVIVDPPRAGMSKEAMQALLRSSPKTLVYLSCDPATLARDARRLTQGGYQLVEATPIDLFPQTYHIETLSLWRR